MSITGVSRAMIVSAATIALVAALYAPAGHTLVAASDQSVEQAMGSGSCSGSLPAEATCSP